MKVYKIKPELTQEQLVEYGFKAVEVETEGTFFFCFVPQPFESDLPQSIISIYNDPKWREKYYKGENRKVLKEKMGLIYSMSYKAIQTKKLKHNVSMWRLQFSIDERFIGLVSADPFDMSFIMNKEIIDKYCDKIISELKEKEMVEEVDYEE